MNHDDFAIGEHFYSNGGEWRCIDIGRHYILAIKIDDEMRRDPSWGNGPPFAVSVECFDAYDLPACSKKE